MRGFLYRIKQTLFAFPWQLYLAITQPARDRFFTNLIKGKRVLILGGGPSATKLDSISDDVLIFACNITPRLLIEKGLRTDVALYLASKNTIRDYAGRIEPVLKDISVDVFVSRNPFYVRKRKDIGSYRVLKTDRFAGIKSNYGLQRLLGEKVKIKGSARRGSSSSGVSLLVYAVLYGASEVYLAGIDLGVKGSHLSDRAADAHDGVSSHHGVDEAIIEAAAQKHDNIFCISSEPTLANTFPTKSLT